MSALLVFLCSSVHQFLVTPTLCNYLPADFPLIPSTIYCLSYLLSLLPPATALSVSYSLHFPLLLLYQPLHLRCLGLQNLECCLCKENPPKPKAPNLLSPLLLPLPSVFALCPQRLQHRETMQGERKHLQGSSLHDEDNTDGD